MMSTGHQHKARLSTESPLVSRRLRIVVISQSGRPMIELRHPPRDSRCHPTSLGRRFPNRFQRRSRSFMSKNRDGTFQQNRPKAEQEHSFKAPVIVRKSCRFTPSLLQRFYRDPQAKQRYRRQLLTNIMICSSSGSLLTSSPISPLRSANRRT